MNLVIEIEFVIRLKKANLCSIDGLLLEGNFKSGDKLFIVELNKVITVKDIAIVKSDRKDERSITFSIEEPTFDFYLIKKGMKIRNLPNEV